MIATQVNGMSASGAGFYLLLFGVIIIFGVVIEVLWEWYLNRKSRWCRHCGMHQMSGMSNQCPHNTNTGAKQWR